MSRPKAKLIEGICFLCKKKTYRKSYDREKKYCSFECYSKGMCGSGNHFFNKKHSSKTKQKMILYKKLNPSSISTYWLGKKIPREIIKKAQENKINPSGSSHYNWKGGKRYTTNGYVMIYSPNHPFRHKRSKTVHEHRLKMEKKIGRLLKKGEVVHHVNGIKSDNRISNLVLMTNSEHSSFHGKKCNKKLYRSIKL